MNAKHTPGPWFLDTSLHIYGQSEPRPLDGFTGGEIVEQPHVCTAKNYANARLIAAAPELLGALMMFVWPYQEQNRNTDTERQEIARAAIAKAIGN